MTVHHFTRVAAAAIAAVAMSSAAQAALITNGSFEDDAVPAGAPGYIYTTPAGWSTTGHNSVVFSTDYSLVSHGNQAVQLEYYGDTLWQTFATSVGTTYLLTYDLSGYENALPSPLETTITGSGTLAFQSVNGQYPNYVTQSLSFTANTTATTLTFLNAGGAIGQYGKYPHIDNVSVSAVPEPESYAMMLLGLGALGAMRRRHKG